MDRHHVPKVGMGAKAEALMATSAATRRDKRIEWNLAMMIVLYFGAK